LEKIWSGLETEDDRIMMEDALMNFNCLEGMGSRGFSTKKAQAAENK
jgi:hypothetical protein